MSIIYKKFKKKKLTYEFDNDPALGLILEFADDSFVFRWIQRMIFGEVWKVKITFQSDEVVTVQIRTFDVIEEWVGIRETEDCFRKVRLHYLVVEFKHQQFRQLQDREANIDGLV